MNNNEKTALALIAGVVVVSSVQYLQVRRTERKKRAEIDLRLKKDLAAIKRGAELTKERMDAGHHYNSITDVMDDFNFNVIAAHLEND